MKTLETHRHFQDVNTAEDLLKILTDLKEDGIDLSTLALENGHSPGFDAVLIERELTDFSIVRDLILG